MFNYLIFKGRQTSLMEGDMVSYDEKKETVTFYRDSERIHIGLIGTNSQDDSMHIGKLDFFNLLNKATLLSGLRPQEESSSTVTGLHVWSFHRI